MKSHSCEKTRGVGVAYTAISEPAPPHCDGIDCASIGSETQAAKGETVQCQHIDAQRRRCRMLVMDPNENLCPHHKERLLLTRRGREAATAELLACLSNFGDSESVHGFLSTLLKQVTLKRIPRRDAVTLAYLCQTILNSLAEGCREYELQLREQRVNALAAPKRPPKVIWDLPHPPYEPDDPVEPEPGNNR